ncbi:uncharacterized protein LOC135822895 [Sycon ciliatum]|uniref:uncharacterized protein LOC135822895 n=1 Tax=Sycon ciliatum TaxID=27933 RepID=UPI0020AE5FB8|eukprot:scpid53038/ scgid30739/ Cytochrome P450 710A2; C-22 sterol desaturase
MAAVLTFSAAAAVPLALLLAMCWTSASLTYVLVAITSCLALYWAAEVVRYRRMRGNLPGPGWTTPFGIGALVTMVLRPVEFWTQQAEYSRNGFSVNAMLGRFMVFVTDGSLCNHVFGNLQDYVLFAHPNARFLFGAENLIYMEQDEHKRFRNLLMPGVYSKAALACYLECQEKACHSHLQKLVGKGEVDARLMLRLMNAEASQESFVGPYLTPDQKKQITEDILTFTLGFLSFPIAFPGSGLWKAIRARETIRTLLTPIAAESKQIMENDAMPAQCVMDFWAKEVVSRRTDGEEDAVSNPDMASTVLDFFFASQDATTSAVVWALHLLTKDQQGERVLENMRQAVGAFLPASERPPMCEVVAPGTYIHTCALECLRARPPVPMVPHLTKHEVVLDGKLKVPAGSMVIPSISIAAEHEPYAGVFNPDDGGGAKDGQFNSTLVFGAGQHKCPGRMYAVQLLAVFMAVLARDFTVKRRLTAQSHNAIYLPTLVPADNWYVFDSVSREKN